MGNIKLEEQLEEWYNVRYRISNEGMEYCFKHYSSFKEIEDDEFHSLRKKLLETMEQMYNMVDNKITEIEVKLLDEDK